jgi:hypothetical protein
MSGRLVILPKKSYCPWKPGNVERVLRDERLEKERVERTEKQRLTTTLPQSTRIEQLAILRGRIDEISPPLQRHVNLFQEEEEESCGNAVSDNRGKVREQQMGILPLVLGQSELETRGDNRPFYLRTAPEKKLLSLKEERRKESLDPMKGFSRKRQSSKFKVDHQFHADDSSTDAPRKKRHESKRRHSKARDKDDESARPQRSKHRDSLESLRQRRLERETVESNRADVLMEGDDDGIWKNDRKRPYHNQYNPGLSRT